MKTLTLFIVSVLLFVSVAQAQYCMLPGRTPYSADQPGITNFKLNTINRTSLSVESMSSVVVVTTDTTVLLRGHTYTVNITHNRDAALFPTARNNIRVWIDYNNNHSFDDTGETVISADLQTYGTYTATFTVPATAPLNTVRLRATVKMSSDAGHSLPTPCDTPVMDPIGYHGEMEDYKVKIAAPTAINELSESVNTVAIYPNPTNGKFMVSFSDKNDDPVAINLYDISGRLIQGLLHEQNQSSLTYSFDLHQYTIPQGVYFIKIISGSTMSCQKIIKVN